MAYKPVLCELKCISRDIKREWNEINEESDEQIVTWIDSIDYEDCIDFLLMVVISIVISVLLYYILNLNTWLALFILLMWVCVIIYMFIKYINWVHQRCINRGQKEQVR